MRLDTEDMDFMISFIKAIEKNSILYDRSDKSYSNKITTDQIWDKLSEEFGEPANELKTKWKNIRTAYVRTKRKPGGVRQAKPYYLAKHLAFLDDFLAYRMPAECCSKRSNNRTAKASHRSPKGPLKSPVKSPVFVETTSLKDGNFVFNDEEIEQNSDTANSEHSEIHYERPNRSLQDSSRQYLNSKIKRLNNIEEEIYSTNNCPTAKRPKTKQEDNYSTKDSCELFLLSLAPEMRSMSQKEQLKFRIGILHLMTKIKFSNSV